MVVALLSGKGTSCTLHELTAALRALLREKHTAVAATVDPDGVPHQTEVWYELRGDRIMINSNVERGKVRNLRRDPRISLLVVDPGNYRYASLTGRVEFDEDQARAQNDIRALCVRFEGEERGDLIWRKNYMTQQRVSIYMTIEKVYTFGVEKKFEFKT